MERKYELMKGALLDKLALICTSSKKVPNQRNNEVYDIEVFTVGDCEISIRNDSVEIVNQRIIRGFDFKDLKTIKVTPKSLIVEYFEIKRRKIIINREKRNN